MYNKFFQAYYDKSSSFEKQLIMWASIINIECSDEFYNNFINSLTNERDKIIARDIYTDGQSYENIKLESLNEKNIAELQRYFDELDGTLLKDLVYQFIQTHKIF